MMRTMLALVLCLGIACGCSGPFESKTSKAKRYQPRCLPNGWYQFDLDTWPESGAVFTERFHDSLTVVTITPTYNHDGETVVGMTMVTTPKEAR